MRYDAETQAPDPGSKVDHTAEIPPRIPVFFRRPTILAMVNSWANEVQAVENAFWQLFTERFLSNATGETLNIWGRIAGEPRNAETDEPYRLRITIRFAVNRSRGKYDALYGIAKLAIGHTNFRLWRGWKSIGLWVFEPVSTTASPAQIKGWMVRAKPLGDSFYYCDSSGGDNPLGCVSTDDPIPALNLAMEDVNAPGTGGQIMGVH